MKIVNNPKRTFFIKNLIILVALAGLQSTAFSQILTSSPYSRYGIGEINSQTFASSSAMGGSFASYQQDTLAPFYINVANPAGLSGIRLSTFELGGQSQFTRISSSTSSINKRNLNFSYAALGFPLKRFGGAAFGIMPYSTVGYKITTTEEVYSVGTMKYIFQGDGGINKVFLGTGIKPFYKAERKFYYSATHDTLVKYHETARYKRKKFGKQLLSELSIGASANYLFGTINQTTDVIYPGSITYFNVKRQRSVQINDFTFNAGIQTNFSIDSVKYHGKDSLHRGHNRALKERIKVGFGAYANLPMGLSAKQNNIIYNYSLDALGVERAKDTVLNSQGIKGNITLPLEIGAGFSVKKGERLNVMMDAAITNWGNFSYFDTPNTDFKNTYRVSAGLSYLPNKLVRGFGDYYKRVQYRIGLSYSDGYLDLKNTSLGSYAVTAGLGLPVGYGRYNEEISVVNISAQYGVMGTTSNNLLREEYVRIILGFTFNKGWFYKYKYD